MYSLRRSPFFWLWTVSTVILLWSWWLSSHHFYHPIGFRTLKGIGFVAVGGSAIHVASPLSLPQQTLPSWSTSKVEATVDHPVYLAPLSFAFRRPDPGDIPRNPRTLAYGLFLTTPHAGSCLLLTIPMWLLTAFPITALGIQLLIRRRRISSTTSLAGS